MKRKGLFIRLGERDKKQLETIADLEAKVRRMADAVKAIAPWMSAALSDPICPEFREAIETVLEADCEAREIMEPLGCK